MSQKCCKNTKINDLVLSKLFKCMLEIPILKIEEMKYA